MIVLATSVTMTTVQHKRIDIQMESIGEADGKQQLYLFTIIHNKVLLAKAIKKNVIWVILTV